MGSLQEKKQQFRDRVGRFEYWFSNPRKLAQFDTPTDIGDQTTELGILSDDKGRERVIHWKHGRPFRKVMQTRWADRACIVDGDEVAGSRPFVVLYFEESEALVILNSNLDERTSIVLYPSHAKFEAVLNVVRRRK